MTTKTNTKLSVQDVITQRFIEALEKGVAPWQMPWQCVSPRNAMTRKPYRGVNLFLLSMLGGDDFFLTFKQVQAMKGQVEKGTKGLPVLFFSKVDKVDSNGDLRKVGFYRYFTVFPANKCNLPNFDRGTKKIDFVPVDEAEKLMALNTCPIAYGGSKAFYRPATHSIQLPNKVDFKSVANYYATAFHEIGHSLKGTKDCNQFGSKEYAQEELVAELFSSLCLQSCNLLGDVVFDNSASYLSSWLEALRNDNKLIIVACKEAHKRFELLTGTPTPSEQSNEPSEDSSEDSSEE
jgi:antirestriction protein ArdC